MRNELQVNPQGSLHPQNRDTYTRADKASYHTLVTCPDFGRPLDNECAEQSSKTLSAPFSEIEKKLSLMYRSIAAANNRANEMKILNEVAGKKIKIAFPAIVFYTVMEELIENAFKFSSGELPVMITFSEIGDKLRIAIISQGSFSRGSTIAKEFVEAQVPSKLSFGIGLALTNKLCKYYNSHFAVYQNRENLIITLEIPVNFR